MTAAGPAGAAFRVTVKFFPWLSTALVADQRTPLAVTEDLPPGATLRDCFRRLAARFPAFAEVIYDPGEDAVHVQAVVTLNGRIANGPAALDLALHPGDVVFLIPAYAGG